MSFRSILAVLLVLVAGLAAQKPRHLWVDAVRGNDANPGTAARPFKSITKGVAVGQVDTVIHVRPGVYSPSRTGERFTITFTGVYKNVKLLGENAASCIVDFERVKASNNSWYFLVDSGARDVEIAHLTLRNGAFRPAVPWYSAAIWWRNVKGLRLHHCVIRSCESGIYSAGGPQNVYVHDNVFLACNVAVRFRQDANAGAKDCRFFHNLVALSTGAFPDTVSPSTKDPTQVFVNNLVVANKGAGFQSGGPLPKGVVFENNDSFGNTGPNYSLGGMTVPKSNLSVDPQLVNLAQGDHRLKPTSPCLEAGYAVGQPGMANDFYGNARVIDLDGDRRALPDIGVFEAGGLRLSVSNWGQGKTAVFSVAPNEPGLGAQFLFVSLGNGSLVLDPFGSIGLDLKTTVLVGSSSVPGKVSLPVPSNPYYTGFTLAFQAFAVKGSAWKPSGRLDLLL